MNTAEEIDAIVACLGDDANTLRAENSECEIAANMEAAANALTALGAEVEALRADAQRYQYLMQLHVIQLARMFGVSFGNFTPTEETVERVTAAIDAMKGTP